MATAAVPRSKLVDLVRCELCLEKYNDFDRQPKLLNCSHTFCLACVQKYYESKLKNKLPCPTCRKEFTIPHGGIQDLNTNTMVVNLLDRLAPYSAVDTDDGFDGFALAKPNPDPTICGFHPGEKCDFYCDDCSDPLCADCMVSITKGPHKKHNIRKLRDVLTTYSTHYDDARQLLINMRVEGRDRIKELLEELALSRDSLMKKAKSKHDKAHQEADRWYHNTTATISKVYDTVHSQIIQLISKNELYQLFQSLFKIYLPKIGRDDLKQAQRFFDRLQSSVTSFKTSTVWPPKFWSVDVGKITDDFTVDLGRITEPTLKLPDVNRFPYTLDQRVDTTEVLNPNVFQQMQNQQGLRLLSDLPMQRACNSNVGMTSKLAIVSFNDQAIIKKITFDGTQITLLKECALPRQITNASCEKYILNNNHVILRDRNQGPTIVLNSQLELVSTIPERCGDIIGAESTHWVAFAGTSEGTIEIYDMEQKQLLQTLTSSSSAGWWLMPSICRHPDSKITAVVDINKSLCIFDHDGHSRHTQWMQTEPIGQNAIACNRRHLYVASDDLFSVSVSVISWSGQLVTTLDEQQLGLQEGQAIYNIAVAEDQFTLAVGPKAFGEFVTNVRTYRCL